MKYLKNLMKHLIKKWLEVDRIEEQVKLLKKRNTTLSSRLNGMNDLVEVGVSLDNSQRRRKESWAVVCIKGKMNYVSFHHLDHATAKDLMKFLERFKPDKVTIDAPPEYLFTFKKNGLPL